MGKSSKKGKSKKSSTNMDAAPTTSLENLTVVGMNNDALSTASTVKNSNMTFEPPAQNTAKEATTDLGGSFPDSIDDGDHAIKSILFYHHSISPSCYL